MERNEILKPSRHGDKLSRHGYFLTTVRLKGRNNSIEVRRAAFTLTEVLITLGIIGIVAALTIPNLVANYQKKIYVVQLQKVYSQLSQAVIQFKADQNVDNLTKTYLTDNNQIGTFFKTYFKVVKDCGYVRSGGSTSDCFASSYGILLDGSSPYYNPPAHGYCVTLNSGASICIDTMRRDFSYYDHGYSRVFIDVNGKNGPNRIGRDFFTFDLYSDGKIGESYDIDGSDRCLMYDDQWGLFQNYGYGCFDKIRKDGWKMDY